MFRVEGVIIWMYSRCEGRVNRGNKRVLNGFRMENPAADDACMHRGHDKGANPKYARQHRGHVELV